MRYFSIKLYKEQQIETKDDIYQPAENQKKKDFPAAHFSFSKTQPLHKLKDQKFKEAKIHN